MVEHSDGAPALSFPKPSSGLARKVGAEMIGTFAMVFSACGAIVVSAETGAFGQMGIAFVFGLVIMVMIYATGHISGAHFNPAVTIAFAASKRFPWNQVPAYIFGQLVAATFAAYLIAELIGTSAHLGATLPSTSLADAFMIEVLITAFLMFVISAVATDSRAVGELAGLAIGGTVALAALFAGPLTGASMNPARSLGPALMAGVMDAQWLYVAAPIVGACLGAFAYGIVRCDDNVDSGDDVGGCC